MGRKVESVNKVESINNENRTSKAFRDRQKIKKDSGFLNVFLDTCKENNVPILTRGKNEDNKEKGEK